MNTNGLDVTGNTLAEHNIHFHVVRTKEENMNPFWRERSISIDGRGILTKTDDVMNSEGGKRINGGNHP